MCTIVGNELHCFDLNLARETARLAKQSEEMLSKAYEGLTFLEAVDKLDEYTTER